MELKKLLIHFNQLQNILIEFSKLIDNVEHPVNLGSAREALMANFLSLNLSELISFHTGEIFDTYDHYSGQIDVVLHPKSSPKLNLFGAINLFPIETVLGAIEVKSTLNTDKLPFFQKYVYNNINELSKIELITQFNLLKDKEISKLKKAKSNSSLAGALETCFKLKRLNLYNSKEKIPFILFVYNYKGKIVNITDKIKNWITELEKQYSKIYFSHNTFDKLNSISELKDKFTDLKNIIFVDENILFDTINRHFRNDKLFPKKNDFYYKYIKLIASNVKTEKFHISEILNLLPDRILVLNNFDNNKVRSCLLKIRSKTTMNIKQSDFYDNQTENVLYELFCFINKLCENWFSNQDKHYFPASEYTNNLKIESYIRIKDFFKF